MCEPFDSRKADIPLPQAVHDLNRLFADNGESLFAVGGAIRDFLIAEAHGGDYSPKDVDLSTEADPKKVLAILGSPESATLGVKAFPKGEAFGVISAVLEGEEYEIATFRQEWYDPESGDGRRPDKVWFGTPGADANRRDLTINALFYEIDAKEIRDYNLNKEGLGQGFADIKNLVARPVGNAHDRFREDKLRILRLVRFFSRFNDGNIVDSLDPNTLAAVEKFKGLEGVSSERIAAEFSTGLAKAKNPASYIQNYEVLGLFPAVFGNLQVYANFLADCKTRNLKAILGWLLRGNAPAVVRKGLNALSYPTDVADRVEFLMNFRLLAADKVAGLLKKRDLYKQLDEDRRQAAWDEFQKDMRDFAGIAGWLQVEYFLAYQPVARSEDFMHLQGAAIGKAMAELETQVYFDGLVEGTT